jgi:hypothetical protein
VNVSNNYSYIFDAFGVPVKIFGNWVDCLNNLDLWYSMPKLSPSQREHFSLEISGADIEELDARLPLPAEEFKIRSGVMIANQNFDFTTYAQEDRQWIDYKGAGRIMVDYAKGAAVSLMCSSAMYPTYQKILFSDYLLDKLLASKNIFSLHASCAVVEGKGIAFTGDSGAGKSTAAFILMQKGRPVLTDEKLYAFKNVNGYQAGAVSDIIKVNDDSVKKFFANPDAYNEYDNISGEHYLKLSGAKTSRWQNQAPLKALCLLEQTGVPQTEITSVSPTKLAGGLFPVTITGAGRKYKEAKFAFIMELMETIECRLVKFGTDMDDFAKKIKELAGKI